MLTELRPQNNYRGQSTMTKGLMPFATPISMATSIGLPPVQAAQAGSKRSGRLHSMRLPPLAQAMHLLRLVHRPRHYRLAQDVARLRQHALAGGGQLHPAAGLAAEQHAAERRLQLRVASDTDGCDTWQARAAALTPPCSTVATKYCSWRSEKLIMFSNNEK